MARHVLCPAAEIPPGENRVFDVGGREIGVYNVDGEFLALRNRCPHQGGPLCEGVAVGALTSGGPGEYIYERPGEVIRCPWHAWEFDLRTGRSWFDPERQRVRAYDVQVLPIEALAEDEVPPRPGMLPGPYRAETIPVEVEGQYLVIELGRV
jgi:3-phenylpropionate/trans-cinnamate dioxygenase ferredoxin subunit